MYILIEILLSLIVSAVPIYLYKRSDKHNKDSFELVLLASIIIFIGAIVRILLIEKIPIGLNQDEASIGYEAYSLINYGIDRNGMTLPVHLISWGSGQNALYAYLIMPFIRIFGLNTFAVRLPMAIIGLITLVVFYYLVKDAFGEKKGLLLLFIFTVIPWHLMKSRWGLESNIFPDLIFYSFALIYYGIKKKNKKYFIFSSIILGISTYAYGTSYLFVPLFCLIIYIYLIIKKKIKIKDMLLYLSITGIISLPMILFVIVNYFNLDTIKIFNITIPKLSYNRFEEVTLLNGNVFTSIFKNLKETIKLFIYQKDEFKVNFVPSFGVIYYHSLIFMLIGMYYSIKNKNIICKLNICLFITSIILSLFVIPNIHRINPIWFSVIIFIGLGLVALSKYKIIFRIAIASYMIIFPIFLITYFTSYQTTLRFFTFKGLTEAYEYASTIDYKEMYVSNYINQPSIYYLYSNKIDPNFFIKNRNIEKEDVMFRIILDIGNVHFYYPEELEVGNVYIFDREMLGNFDEKRDSEYVKCFGYYCVIDKTKEEKVD